MINWLDELLGTLTNNDGSITIVDNVVSVGVLATDAQHGLRGAGSSEAPMHSLANADSPGFMSAADKTKLNGLERGPYTATTVDGTTVPLLDGNGNPLSFSIPPSGAALVIITIIARGVTGPLANKTFLVQQVAYATDDGGSPNFVNPSTPADGDIIVVDEMSGAISGDNIAPSASGLAVTLSIVGVASNQIKWSAWVNVKSLT